MDFSQGLVDKFVQGLGVSAGAATLGLLGYGLKQLRPIAAKAAKRDFYTERRIRFGTAIVIMYNTIALQACVGPHGGLLSSPSRFVSWLPILGSPVMSGFTVLGTERVAQGRRRVESQDILLGSIERTGEKLKADVSLEGENTLDRARIDYIDERMKLLTRHVIAQRPRVFLFWESPVLVVLNWLSVVLCLYRLFSPMFQG